MLLFIILQFLAGSYPATKTWDFVFLNSCHRCSSDNFLGGVQWGLGLPGVGNSPIRNTRLAAGCAAWGVAFLCIIASLRPVSKWTRQMPFLVKGAEKPWLLRKAKNIHWSFSHCLINPFLKPLSHILLAFKMLTCFRLQEWWSSSAQRRITFEETVSCEWQLSYGKIANWKGSSQGLGSSRSGSAVWGSKICIDGGTWGSLSKRHNLGRLRTNIKCFVEM